MADLLADSLLTRNAAGIQALAAMATVTLTAVLVAVTRRYVKLTSHLVSETVAENKQERRISGILNLTQGGTDGLVHFAFTIANESRAPISHVKGYVVLDWDLNQVVVSFQEIPIVSNNSAEFTQTPAPEGCCGTLSLWLYFIDENSIQQSKWGNALLLASPVNSHD